MANERHLGILKKGVEAWNTWREKNFEIRPDLSGADLSGANFWKANLSKANLSKANLSGAYLNIANLSNADLSGANLSEADLGMADLSGANLGMANLSGARLGMADLSKAKLWKAYFSGADLSNANLGMADLSEANLSRANLSEANLSGADLRYSNSVEANFEKANLSGCRIYGISAWGIKGKPNDQSNLIITPGDESEVRVDNLEVAQFIYLMLHSEKIRDVINTIGKKGVLILGRFTLAERKDVLDAIREKLRQLGYLPIVFDFERPIDRDFTETIMTLTGMCLFVIADITNPKSSPLELQATVPNYKIPFVPIIQKGEKPFAMFKDLKEKYSWVLDILAYDSVSNLMKSFEKAIIKRAEEKHNQLMAEKAEELRIIDSGDYQ